MSTTVPPVLLLFMMVLAGIGDFLTFRIPNWLSGAVALAFVPMAVWTGMPLETVGIHMATGFAFLVVGFVLFAGGVFGGGDAKLMAAAALWFGYPDTIHFLVYTILAGGVLGIAISFWNVVNIDLEVRGFEKVRRIIDYKPDIPYGLAFAAGAVATIPGSWWLPATPVIRRPRAPDDRRGGGVRNS